MSPSAPADAVLLGRLSSRLDAYFAGVKGAVRALGTSEKDDAVKDLVSLFDATKGTISVDGADIVRGSDEIRGFYERGVLSEEGFWPRPVEDSRAVVADNAIVVDIFLHSNRRTRLVRDVFRYDDDGLISRMEVETITDHKQL